MPRKNLSKRRKQSRINSRKNYQSKRRNLHTKKRKKYTKRRNTKRYKRNNLKFGGSSDDSEFVKDVVYSGNSERSVMGFLYKPEFYIEIDSGTKSINLDNLDALFTKFTITCMPFPCDTQEETDIWYLFHDLPTSPIQLKNIDIRANKIKELLNSLYNIVKNDSDKLSNYKDHFSKLKSVEFERAKTDALERARK